MVDESNRTMLHYVAFQDTLMNDGDDGNGKINEENVAYIVEVSSILVLLCMLHLTFLPHLYTTYVWRGETVGLTDQSTGKMDS